MNTRTFKKIAALVLTSLLATSTSFAQNDLSEGVFVEDDSAVDQIMGDDDQKAQIDSDLSSQPEQKSAGQAQPSATPAPESEAPKKQAAEEAKPTDTLDNEEEAEEVVIEDSDEPEDGKTEEITKEIVEEPEAAPPAEFPYPGATEEGYETKLAAQDTPVDIIRPIRMTTSGEYYYGFKSSPSDASASLRFGYFGPPEIVNPSNNKKWEEIYSDENIPTLFIDYEWMLTRGVGILGLKASSGVFVGQGKGQFAVADPDRANREAIEKYSFVMFPNIASVIYRFQYADGQIFVPYAEGGAGYFTFAEIRDDGTSPKFGGAAVAVAAGGFSFLVDWLDQQSVRQLDNDWGINHVWLSAEYRLIQGLNKEYDFTSGIINAGLRMEF